jgi:hypothetical protein
LFQLLLQCSRCRLIADADSSNLIDTYYIAAAAGTSSGGDFGKLCGPTTELAYKNDGVTGNNTSLTASETQGIWLPFQLADNGMTADGTSGYSAGDTVTDCNPSQEDWTQGLASGANTTANRLMNVVTIKQQHNNYNKNVSVFCGARSYRSSIRTTK